MKRIAGLAAMILIGCAGFSYCADSKAVNRSPFSFMQGFVMSDEYVEYQDKLQKIEDSYKKGEITKEKCLEMKSDAAKEYKDLGRGR